MSSILVGLSFGFRPANVGNPLSEKSDDERIFAFDSLRVNGEKLRDSVSHDLLELRAGDGLEAAEKLRTHKRAADR